MEGRVFIKEVRDPELAAQGVKPGVEIIAVDGLAVKQFGAEKCRAHSRRSTPQDLDIKVFEYSLLGGPLENPGLSHATRRRGEHHYEIAPP